MSVDRIYPVPRQRDLAHERIRELQDQIESLEAELEDDISQNRQSIEELKQRVPVPDAPDEGRGPGSEPE